MNNRGSNLIRMGIPEPTAIAEPSEGIYHRNMNAIMQMLLRCLVCVAGFSLYIATAGAEDNAALEIFQRRIVPILQAKNPSSCSECHLSGVDLKQYIRPTQEDTYASLRDAGLIDVGNPEKSKLLEFIGRKPNEPNPVSEKVRGEEYAAFEAWIKAAVSDPALIKAQTEGSAPGPTVPLEVVRHARKDRVLQSFLDNVWSEVGRCAACHSPDRNQKQVEEHGEQVSWIQLDDPQGTLNHLLEAELIDLKNPQESLLLAKPTMRVEHGGGIKLLVGDRTYKQFLNFIQDYARTTAGEYRLADELPQPSAEVSYVSDIWLKVTDIPESLDGKLLRADVYRWDERSKRWSTELWATGDRGIYGKGKLWQQHLTLVAPRESSRARELTHNELPPGKYRVVLYVDRQQRLATDLEYQLGEHEKVGDVELESNWPHGYDNMTLIRYPE